MITHIVKHFLLNFQATLHLLKYLIEPSVLSSLLDYNIHQEKWILHIWIKVAHNDP